MKKTELTFSSTAITGFILSMLLFLPLTSLLGFIFSIIGLIKTNKPLVEGKGLAIAGIIISSIRLLIEVGAIMLFLLAVYNY